MNQEYERIQVSIPHRAEYISLVRLAVSSVANRMGFDVESIEDIKVAVSEACANAILHDGCPAGENFVLTCQLRERNLDIFVSDYGRGYEISKIRDPEPDHLNEGGLGIFIIKSLMDEVKIESGKGQGTSIRMTKNLREDS